MHPCRCARRLRDVDSPAVCFCLPASSGCCVPPQCAAGLRRPSDTRRLVCSGSGVCKASAIVNTNAWTIIHGISRTQTGASPGQLAVTQLCRTAYPLDNQQPPQWIHPELLLQHLTAHIQPQRPGPHLPLPPLRTCTAGRARLADACSGRHGPPGGLSWCMHCGTCTTMRCSGAWPMC
jgi:hypothetical protein